MDTSFFKIQFFSLIILVKHIRIQFVFLLITLNWHTLCFEFETSEISTHYHLLLRGQKARFAYLYYTFLHLWLSSASHSISSFSCLFALFSLSPYVLFSVLSLSPFFLSLNSSCSIVFCKNHAISQLIYIFLKFSEKIFSGKNVVACCGFSGTKFKNTFFFFFKLKFLKTNVQIFSCAISLSPKRRSPLRPSNSGSTARRSSPKPRSGSI